MNRTPILVALLLLFQSACRAGTAEQESTLAWSFESVSLQSPDDAMTVTPWGTAIDRERQLVYVLDRPQSRVLVFDSDGNYRSQLGGAGAAEHEFRSPSTIAVRPDGTLIVLDTGLGRVSYWLPSGSTGGVATLPVSYWGPGLASIGDDLLYVTTTPSADPLEIRQTLVRTGQLGVAPIRSVSQYQTEVSLPCMTGLMPKLFGAQVVWTTFADTVLIAQPNTYAIDYLVGDQVVRSVTRDIPPLQITREMAAARLEAGQFRRFLQMCGIDAGTTADAVGFEPIAAPTEWVAVSPDGKLWVTRTPEAEANSRVDVFSPRGEFLGTAFGIPAPVAFLANGRYVGYEVDRSMDQVQLLMVQVEELLD